MAYEQRDNSGSVFENDRKEKDTHPDFTGKAMVNGVMYWASLWVKESRDGGEFFSLAFKPMDDAREPQRPQQQPAQERQAPRQSRRVATAGGQQQPQRQSSGFDDMDDDIPF